MLQLVSKEQHVGVKSTRVCTIPNSENELVAEVVASWDFQEFDQFHGLFGGKSECCSCHRGLKDDEVQLIAVWHAGAEAALSLLAYSDSDFGDVELARWEVVVDDAKPADEELLKRVRSMKLQQLVLRGTHLGQNEDWIAECLHTANRLRARHGAAPLQWCPKAAAEARNKADRLAIAAKQGEVVRRASVTTQHDEAFKHGFGQSIYFPGAQRFRDSSHLSSAKTAINHWYEEQFNPGYDFCKPSNIRGTTDFTQLVWAKTTHIGMDCDSMGHGYIVACYSPPGNINGQFDDNVHRAENANIVSLVKAKFRAFDQNGDNQLSYRELEKILRTLDPSFSRQEIEFVMTTVDKDGNGKIDFHEFLDWFGFQSPKNGGA